MGYLSYGEISNSAKGADWVAAEHRRDQQPLHIGYLSALGGGADTYVQQIAHELTIAGHRVTIIYLTSPRQTDAAPPTAHLKYVFQPLGNLHYYYRRIAERAPAPVRTRLPDPDLARTLESTITLRRALRQVERARGALDIVEVFEGTAFPALFRQTLPYAVKLHSSEATWRYFCGEGLRPVDWQRIRLEGELLRSARLVTSPSAALADHVADTCLYPRQRIAVLPYPLNLSHFRPAPVSDGQQRVLFVGRMDQRKGLETLIDSAHIFLARFPASTLEIVGGETPEVTGDSLLARLEPALRNRVIFHGRVPHTDLASIYQSAAVCVVPSSWDNSPNTVYEAMGCGRPLVASRVGGIPELVDEGSTGLLVPPRSASALGEAVSSLLGERARAEAMGRAARTRAEALFAPARIAQETVALYRSALVSPSRSGTTTSRAIK